ncbi:serine/arginine-rich splicing factor 4 isoform X3 [Eurytemora carolleeae]|uniref:serine/arginine-rich splicing factor 4 isoform X2 n=1 Tax=Eurytemora carolleeae TaxID=1294199 RepID=UPI000C7600D6|nr:serine/arginine-rich splicing factor 4 isoform X2 [Eurytemora carolleeae]XP_023337968.1 serine/arginine-rich splicing factor 4 isoform X3 [Eurytemora carolleeae]|eukprot:XP_023337967.1 serine/arginine-rich splicing factor 4-like isoform X2 [Eurytemora affinis]
MERVKVKVDESHVPKTSKEQKNVKFEEPVVLESDRMTSILLRTMYVQWVIITFLIGIIFVRLVYSTDENWTFFVSSTLILCFAVIPIIITISCVDCCSKKKSNKEEKKKVSNDETDDKSSTTKQIKPRKSRSTTRKSKPKPASEEDTPKSTTVSKDTTVPEKKQPRSVSKKRKTSKPRSISKNRVKSKSRSVSKRRKPSKSRSTSRKPSKPRSVSIKSRTASKPRPASKKREMVDSPSITDDIISLSQSLFGEPWKTRSKSRPRSTSKPRSSSRKRRSSSKPRSSSRKRRSSSKPRSSSRKRNSSKPRNVSKTRKPRSESKKREPSKNQNLNAEPKVSFTENIVNLSQVLFGEPKKKPVKIEPKAITEDPSKSSKSEEKKINLEIKVECVDENNTAGVSNLNVHAQVENDHLDMETQLGSEGADVYSEAKVEDEGENSSIKITIDTEQPDTGLEVENTLIGDEKRITATLDNDGVEQTKKIKVDLETDSDSDHEEAEGHIHIDSKKA